jgi:hypothetical protein
MDLLGITNKDHWQQFSQYAEHNEPSLMGALYHPEEVPLNLSSPEMIMPLF